MEKQTLNIMQKTTLEPDQVIEVNGAILNAEILAEIRQLQTGMDSMETGSIGINHGIKSDIEEYQKLLNFLVSQAAYFSEPEKGLHYIDSVLARMEYFQLLRVPGTEKVNLY